MLGHDKLFPFPKLKLKQNFFILSKNYLHSNFEMEIRIINRELRLSISNFLDINSLKVNTIMATQYYIQLDKTEKKAALRQLINDCLVNLML